MRIMRGKPNQHQRVLARNVVATADGLIVAKQEEVDILRNFGFVDLPQKSFDTNPTPADDKNRGYAKGAVWLNLGTNQLFVCLDAATKAAVWTKEKSWSAIYTALGLSV